MLKAWWHNWQSSLRNAKLASTLKRRAIDENLWQSTLSALPFLAQLDDSELSRLRQLASLFLDSKEFSGAQGFSVTDAHAVMVATQACLPILHIAPPDRPDLALAWYDGFVGIVLHAGEVRARREWVDEHGIAHSGSEDLTGEILEGGPLMLAWSDVQAAGELAEKAYNVVIHEFIHVMDVRDGQADGCPPMPRDQRHQWRITLQAEYERFVEASEAWQRFGSIGNASGQTEPLLDPYGSSSIDEFFAVAAEAYFVQRDAFALQLPNLLAIFDRFFRGSV
jgi:Mlc titration factor MtfA (ptsG expression regulator)